MRLNHVHAFLRGVLAFILYEKKGVSKFEAMNLAFRGWIALLSVSTPSSLQQPVIIRFTF
jgi:hypothetical protein